MATHHLALSPGHRLAGRVRPVVARLRAELDEHLPPDTVDAQVRQRWLSRVAQTLDADSSAVPAPRTVPEPRSRPDAVASGAFHVLMTGLVDAVGDHPDRDRLLIAGSVAVHEALRATDDPVLATVGLEPADRERLARDLHDWVGNGVSLALRQLELYAIDTARGHPDPGRRVTDAGLTLEELLLSTRRLIADLRGVTWVTDLVTELREYVARANVLGAECTVALTPPGATVPALVRDEMFLAVREALRNAFTHARPTRVEVTIRVVDGRVWAQVDDDGIGLGAAPAGRGSGLTTMRERVEAMGGWIELGPRSPRGTRVELVMVGDGGSTGDDVG